MIKTDFRKKELKIGDNVAFIIPRNRIMVEGVVVGFTDLMVKIKYDYYDVESVVNRFEWEIVKIEKWEL